MKRILSTLAALALFASASAAQALECNINQGVARVLDFQRDKDNVPFPSLPLRVIGEECISGDATRGDTYRIPGIAAKFPNKTYAEEVVKLMWELNNARKDFTDEAQFMRAFDYIEQAHTQRQALTNKK